MESQMDSLFVLAGYVLALVVLIGLVAHVSSKASAGDDFGLIEKAGFVYLGGAVIVAIIEGYNGASVAGALVPAIRWPLDVVMWVVAQARAAGI